MLRKIRFLSNKKQNQFISIDLGTTTTLVYVSNQGLIYNEPSIIAYNTRRNSIIAVGAEAYKILGKDNKNIKVVRPLINGVIADVKATEVQLKYIFNKLNITKQTKNSIVLVACPSSITNLEREALKQIVLNLGAKKVFIEEEVKMAAIGGGINIYRPEGYVVVDIGGGTTDVAVIASGDIVISQSIKIAGNTFNEAIQKYVHSKYNLEIGENTTENLKIYLSSLKPYEEELAMTVFGSDTVSGLPKKIDVLPSEIRTVMQLAIEPVVHLIIDVLKKTPAELSSDLHTNGITICGGGALIRGIADFISEHTHLPASIGETPILAVINGTKKYETTIFEEIALTT